MLAAASAQAVSLTPVQRITTFGPTQVTALAGLPDGSRLLCLDSRWVKLGAAGQVTLATALPEACQTLHVSPDGQTLLTGPAWRVWSATDGHLVRDLPDALSAGILNSQEVVIRTAAGLERLNISTGQTTPLRPGPLTAFLVSPDGNRAVGSDGQRVQLLRLPDLTPLSGYRCEGDCTVKNAAFSVDGRTAAVQVGRQLIGLRDGVPASTVHRNVENAVGFPRPDNTVLTISEGGVEIHDFQTGRREKQVTTGVTPPAAPLPGGRILALSDKVELLDADLTFQDVKRLPLPATVQAGGLDASGTVYALHGGVLTLGQKRVSSRENLDVIDPKKNPAFNGAREALGTLARYSPDSKWLAYVGRNQAAQPVLRLLNLSTGQDEATSPPLADLPTFLTWSADSKKLAVRASLASELTSVTVFEVR